MFRVYQKVDCMSVAGRGLGIGGCRNGCPLEQEHWYCSSIRGGEDLVENLHPDLASQLFSDERYAGIGVKCLSSIDVIGTEAGLDKRQQAFEPRMIRFEVGLCV